MKKSSFLLIIGIILILFAGAYTGYLFWQKSVSAADLNSVEKALGDYKKEMLQFENKRVVQAVSAKQTVKSMKADMIKWSEVINKILSTIPERKGIPIVNILSYSGSSGSNISMNVKTLPGGELYFDVAKFIQTFDDSSNFRENFVPSISTGENDEGDEILTFTFNTKYVKENIEDAMKKVLENREDSARKALEDGEDSARGALEGGESSENSIKR